jgi:3-oxosteroid 1-dehydrogenase
MPISTPSPPRGAATVEVDALVVGAGAAGMTAALVCALEGLDVLLCEKSDRVGGTTATSAGTIWVPGTGQSREAGFTDNVAAAKGYLEAVIGAATDKRRDTYLETGPEVVDYLDRRSEVKFAPYTRHPDYLANRPGATIGGRPLAPLPFDGRLLGADFELVRPPIGEFMALGGMMIGRDDVEPLVRPFASLTAFRAATSLLWRHATDRLRYRRGTRLLMGNALVARLFYSLRRNGVPVWLNVSLLELTVVSGRVCGAVVSVKGNLRRVTVRRGIVLATGGFGGSIDRLNDYVRPPLAHAVAFAGAAGDGIRIGRTVGASVDEDHACPRLQQRLNRVRPAQWRSGPRTESLPRPHRDASLLRDGCLSEHAGNERRSEGRPRRPGHDRNGRSNSRPIRLRQRHGVDHARTLSGPGNQSRTGLGFRVSGGHGDTG